MAHELGQAHTQMGFELLQPYDKEFNAAITTIEPIKKTIKRQSVVLIASGIAF